MSEDTIKSVKSRSMLPVIDVGLRHKGHPLAITFVYSPKGNVAVKGNPDAVYAYIHKHYPVCLYRYSYWRNGQERGSWRMQGVNLREIHESDWREEYISKFYASVPRHNKFVVMSADGKRPLFSYRRLPRRWLEDWNNALKPETKTR